MISIIIPTLNEEDYLPKFLECIAKQNFNDYEIIVADANSKDKTVEIAKRFGCIITKGGLPSKGRNEGAKIAKGEIFLFLDADIVDLPDNFLEDLIFQFKKNNLDVASFPIEPKENRFDKFVYKFYNLLAKILQGCCPFATNGILVKREIFERIGGFDEEIKLAEDHNFVQRAAKISKFGFLATKPILVSNRRLKKDGRIKTYLKYIFAGIYMLFFGPIKSDIFKYKFAHYKNIDKK